MYSIADYGHCFALLYFGTSPLSLDKIIMLAICIFILNIVMLISAKIGSYVDNINNVKVQNIIQNYYFNKMQSMTMEQIANTHTGYIHKLITKVSFTFFEMTWQLENSVIPLIIGGTSIFIMACKQSVLTGIICILISALAVILKYKMIKDKQIYQKKTNEAESRYNAIFTYTKDSVEINIPEFVLNKGEKVSIIGESGQGKTTVMNILAGLYPLNDGSLLINNVEKNNSRLDLVFVSQEVDLFDLSIRDNICLGKDISDEKILELLEEAGLLKWYNELPNGLDTMVGEREIKLSAGQKQRLNLIRGILIDKDLYFFDEPTSNLDVLSEGKIINMIEKYLKNKTYVIVTHRPKLEVLCNKHYVFEQHTMKELLVA